MRIVHTSDIHLDSPLTSKLPPDKARARRRELLSGFARLVEEARSIGTEAIIIAGDLFDNGKISRNALDAAMDIISSAEEITFFYLEGNHEGGALQACGRDMPKNLVFFGDDWTYFAANGITIAGRNRISENMFDSLDLPAETKNIVVLHGELKDKSEYPESIGIKEAVGKNIDYLALGHYHSHSISVIDDRGSAVYSGTPEGRGFDEIGDKGYVMLNVSEKRVDYVFRKFAKRRLHIIPVDISGAVRALDIETRADRALREIPYSDLVRLELCGKYSPDLFKDIDALYRNFEEKYYYFEIKDSSRIAINPEDYKYDKSLKGEFIRAVSADNSIDDSMKEKIIACGINALMGEELFEA